MNTRIHRDEQGRFARETRVRFTAYGSGDIPLAHAATKAEAIARGSKQASVVAVVKRLRAYPFTHLKRWEL